jgi:hypothetical protein
VSDDRRTEALLKLEQILDRLTSMEARETVRDGILEAQTQALNYAAEAIGTLVVEVAQLSKAASEEPKSDIGIVLRRLAEAVEQNTAALHHLVAQTAARRH